MSIDDEENLSERERLVGAVEAAQKSHKAQSNADSLKSKAKKLTNRKERERLFKEAFAAEVEAHGHSKLAKRLQSGTWQGGGIGGGIGAGVGIGLGTVVGTLVGGVASVPTTGLGVLVGATTGALHGPFIKIDGVNTKLEDADPEKVVDALEQEQTSQHKPRSHQDVKDPPGSSATQESKKKPRKIEIRSNIASERSTSTGPAERRKPRKIELRSQSQQTESP